MGLYDEAERSIARAFELGHTDDGSMWLRLARIFVRRHIVCPSNSRYLAAALEAFGEALKFKRVNSRPMHYLEVSDRLTVQGGEIALGARYKCRFYNLKNATRRYLRPEAIEQKVNVIFGGGSRLGAIAKIIPR